MTAANTSAPRTGYVQVLFSDYFEVSGLSLITAQIVVSAQVPYVISEQCATSHWISLLKSVRILYAFT